MTAPDTTSTNGHLGTAIVGGRQIRVKSLTDAQFMMLTHEATLLQNKNVDTSRKITGVDRVFRILKSVIADEVDAEFVQDKMADGELTMTELADALLEVTKKVSEAPTTGPVAKPRRGRPARQQ